MIALAMSSRAVDILLVGAIGLALLAPLVARAIRRRLDPFEPIVVFALAYGVMFVVRPAAMLVEGSLVHEGPRRALDVSGEFTEMLVLALLGALAFGVGYLLPLGARLASLHRPSRPDPSDGRLLVASLLVGLVGVIAYLFVLSSSGFTHTIRTILRAGNTEVLEAGSASIYASFVFLLTVPASLVILMVGLKRRSAALIITSLGFAALIVVLSLPVGNRIALLPLLGGFFSLYYLRRLARPSLAAILVVALVAVVASAFLSDLRGRATRDESVLETVERTTSPSRLVDSVTTGPDTEMAAVLAAALSVIPERLSHTYGSTIFGDLVIRPIPRSLWKEKPSIPRTELTATIWPVESERGTVKPEYSALLYFYWDLALIGVIIGMAAYGLLARYLYEFLSLNRERQYAQVFYSLALWFVVIGVRDGPVDTFVRACFVLAPLWGIYVLARLPLGARSERSVSAGQGVAS